MTRDDKEYIAARQFEAFANDLLDLDMQAIVALLDAYKKGCFLYQEAQPFYDDCLAEPHANGNIPADRLQLDDAA